MGAAGGLAGLAATSASGGVASGGAAYLAAGGAVATGTAGAVARASRMDPKRENFIRKSESRLIDDEKLGDEEIKPLTHSV